MYKFIKFKFILNVVNGSFFSSSSRLFHDFAALYLKLLCPVVVQNRGICSESLFLVAYSFNSLCL